MNVEGEWRKKLWGLWRNLNKQGTKQIIEKGATLAMFLNYYETKVKRFKKGIDCYWFEKTKEDY